MILNNLGQVLDEIKHIAFQRIADLTSAPPPLKAEGAGGGVAFDTEEVTNLSPGEPDGSPGPIPIKSVLTPHHQREQALVVCYPHPPQTRDGESARSPGINLQRLHIHAGEEVGE